MAKVTLNQEIFDAMEAHCGQLQELLAQMTTVKNLFDRRQIVGVLTNPPTGQQNALMTRELNNLIQFINTYPRV